MNALILSAGFGVILMLTGAFSKNKTLPNTIAIIGAILLLLVNGLELYAQHPIFNYNQMDMLAITSGNLTFLQVVFAALLAYFLLNRFDVQRVGEHVAEYYALMFFITCGMILVSTYNTLLMLFLGIEIMSIPQYVLAGADKRDLKSNEAAIKYFLMGSFSTGILLMGIAFMYGGSANATFYLNNLHIGSGELSPMMAIGMVFMLVSMAFKVSAAPFHFWTPDVYDGAPTTFTSFISTLVKVAGFYAFIRLFSTAFGAVQAQWQTLLIVLIVATLFMGNLTAVFQQSVKRMLAYSSIAQAGFMLFTVFASSEKGNEAIVLYAAAYCFATIGLFAVLSKMNDYTIEGFNGLYKTQPTLAICATICLLSLTGIPLTAGFLAKFSTLMAAMDAGAKIWLLVVAVLFAAMSAYYYFRVIQAIYFKQPTGQPIMMENSVTPLFKWTLVAVTVIIIILGIYPELVVGWLYYY